MPTTFNKRIVGLPVWAWVAIVAGGLTIGLILRSRQKDTEDVEDFEDAETLDYYDDVYAEEYYGEFESLAAGPNAIDTLGTGGYVNYPIQPIQPGINVTVGGGGTPCLEADRPKRKPKKGTQWGCRNGVWVMIPLPRRGGRHGGGGGGKNQNKANATGGGPPVTRDAHRPLGGLPKGNSSDVLKTWVPGNPSILIPTR